MPEEQDCVSCGKTTSQPVNYMVKIPGLNRWFLLPQCPDCKKKVNRKTLQRQALRTLTTKSRK